MRNWILTRIRIFLWLFSLRRHFWLLFNIFLFVHVIGSRYRFAYIEFLIHSPIFHRIGEIRTVNVSQFISAASHWHGTNECSYISVCFDKKSVEIGSVSSFHREIWWIEAMCGSIFGWSSLDVHESMNKNTFSLSLNLKLAVLYHVILLCKDKNKQKSASISQ